MVVADLSTTPPGVSYVMPILNEADYLESAVESILLQDYPGPTEIVLALGPSDDGTGEIADKLADSDERIRIVHNPGQDIPIGLNLAIRSCRYPVIVRVDAHTELSNGYTKRGVDTLLRTGAANVGGIMAAVGAAGVQEAVARAYNSRFGLGGGAYHHEDVTEGPAESAYLGVMRASALAEIGGFDETLRRGEDWELNYRLRHAGYVVWLDPQLHVTYWPRNTWRSLTQQFFSTGVWRGELVRRLGEGNSPRFFAPPVLITATGAALVLTPLLATGVLSGAAAIVAGAVCAAPLTYLGFLGVAAASEDAAPADRLRFAGVLATMHFAWGAGFLIGAARGARDTVDTSRHAGVLSPASRGRRAARPLARLRARRRTA